MSTKLSDTSKAAIFTMLVLCLAVAAALLIRFLGISSDPVIFSIWSCTPTLATLIMLLVLTRDGYSREGWKSLGLHRLGLNVWWIAFGVTLLVTVAASAVVWATPLASFAIPEGGIIDPVISFFIFFGMSVVWFALLEEIGMRGYLQPRLMSLGRTRALVLVGLVFATWHMPLIFLAPQQVDFPTGNLLLFFPLFYGTFVAASFFFGYMRVYTGSTWPASIAHAVHNSAWGVLGALTLITASPVLVNVYLVGDFGLLILIGSAIGAIWFGRRYKSGMDQAQSADAAEVSRAAPVHPSAPAAPR
jgi:membrane protease YdiL (CAAX protease family)